MSVFFATALALGVLVVAWGILPRGAGQGTVARSAGPSPIATSGTSTVASTSPDASGGPPAGRVALAVVSGFDNYAVTSITRAELASRLASGTLIVPCGAESAVARALGSTGTGAAMCVAADQITGALAPASTELALLPPALVTPRVKVVPLEGADLFGEKPARATPYPLTIARPATWPAAWSAWTASDVRVVVTTGVNCPDRGVSHQTVVLKKGWDWLLQAGTARYTGTHWYAPMGWYVVDAVRTGHAGALLALLKNADVTVSDFECPMTRAFTQHDSGTNFSIDPRVAAMMATAGFDVATIGADHNTNAGLAAVGETVDDFRANHIQPTGAGRTLDEALRPAVVDAHGITFGFVGFDAIGGSTYATATTPGVAPLTLANARVAIAKARAAGAQVIIALPQWSNTEYHANFTAFQDRLTALLFNAGADHIVGADFHWAGGVSISRTGSTYRYVGASQGNFWFGQDWSRQTEEGVITTLSFVGTKLIQVRLTPTVVIDNAQVNLTDPATDGQYVLHQVLAVSTLPSK
jgi:poly-gamma-glutamate capsule biosynthesis protein CapA/YwtB (metallophosphatase superfamily)